MNDLTKHILKLGNEITIDMEDECDGSYVGAEDESEFEFEGKKYKLTITAFWEKSRWFEYTVGGVGFDFHQSGNDF